MTLQPGDMITQTAKDRDHTYKLILGFTRVHKDGLKYEWLMWEGTCQTCGEMFLCKSPMPPGPYLTRRCRKHAKRNHRKKQPQVTPRQSS